MQITSDAAMSGLEALLAGLGDSTNIPDAPKVDTTAAGAETLAPEAGATPEKPAGKKKGGGRRKKTEPAVDSPGQETPAAGQMEGAAQQPEGAPQELPADETASGGEPEDDKPAAPKKIYWGANKLGRLHHKLGGDLDKFFVLTLADVELEGEHLERVVTTNKLKFKALAKKVQNRATGLIEFASGKTDRVSDVMKTALRLLAREREIVTGDQGNLHKRLLGTYTPDTARAMGRSTLGALTALGIVKTGTKQQFVPDDTSVFLAMLSQKLGLSFVDISAELDQEDQDEASRLEAMRMGVANEGTSDVVDPGAEEGGDAPKPSGEAIIDDLIGGIVNAASNQELNALAAVTM